IITANASLAIGLNSIGAVLLASMGALFIFFSFRGVFPIQKYGKNNCTALVLIIFDSEDKNTKE
ncbi:MAG TPA: hypothetical protein PK522_09570, partial [Nitrosomonas sp.]|nr:hypothetical protein [Nitrosomonas sp.]